MLVGKPEERGHWGDQDVDGRIILRWIYVKWDEEEGTCKSGKKKTFGFYKMRRTS